VDQRIVFSDPFLTSSDSSCISDAALSEARPVT